nr:hypothetical protein Iba_chr04dCG14610 [Ipomoea batatas]
MKMGRFLPSQQSTAMARKENFIDLVLGKDRFLSKEAQGDLGEGEFEEEDKVDENGESSNEDDGEQGKGETEQNGLPDGFYLVEAVRKKRVRQVGHSFN